jgi:hypothetical protein
MARTAADRARSAQVRAWAKDEGLLPADSHAGRIPGAVYDAYDGAHPLQVVSEDAPDWATAAAVAGTGDPLAGLGDEPPPPSPASPEPAYDLTGLPPEEPAAAPPVSLDEARDRFGGGPRKPPPWGKQGKQARPDPPPVKITPSVQADIRGQLVLLLGALAMPLQIADPYCGTQFAGTVEAQADAWLPLICQSPTVVTWFSKGTVVMLWIGLVSAYRGLALRAWHHHVLQDVIVIDGQAYEAVRLPDGRIVPKEAPPAPSGHAAQNSMYPTVTGHVPPVPQAG